jgi:hypothetical protein
MMPKLSGPSLPDPSSCVWSLAAAKVPFINGRGKRSNHHFLLLIEKSRNARPRILDELHFIEGKKHEETEDVELGAMAYINTSHMTGMRTIRGRIQQSHSRKLGKLHPYTYMRGSARIVLQAWNDAMRAAIEIKDQGLFFSHLNNCRTGSYAIIEKLGYRPRMASVIAVPRDPDALVTKMTSRPLRSQISAAKLVSDFHCLHQNLQLRRPTPAALRKNRKWPAPR